MKQFYATLFLLLSLIACSGESTQNSISNRETKPKEISESLAVQTKSLSKVQGDSISIELLKKFKISVELPYFLDTIQMEKVKNTYTSDAELFQKPENQLSLKEVKFLAASISNLDSAENQSWYFEQYERFSNFSKSEYQHYLNSLDIGMLRELKFYAKERIQLKDSTELLVWYFKFATMDACPYGYGVSYFGSVVASGKLQTTLCLAEKYSSGDPPIFSGRKMDFIIDTNQLFVQNKIISKTDEMENEEGILNLVNLENVVNFSGKISRDSISRVKKES